MSQVNSQAVLTLMDHQIVDAQFLADRKIAGCFNGMGTGKTLTSLEAAKLVEADRVVIVAPPIALQMWSDVAYDWLDKGTMILRTGKTTIQPTVDVLVCSYDIMMRRKDELIDWVGGHKAVLICDESHALKSTKAKRTAAVLGRGGLVNAFDHSWFLTGTPMTRWPDDLIPFLFRAAPDQIREKVGGLNIQRYNLRYCVVQERKFPGARFPVKMTVGARNLEELGEILATCSTRRTLQDVWEAMPDLTHTRLPVPLAKTPELTEALKQLNDMTQAEVDEGVRKQEESLSTVRRLIGLGMIPESVKFVAERVDAGIGGILVGAWHREVIDALQAELQKIKIDGRNLVVKQLTGSTPPTGKPVLEREFNAGDLDVLVGQIGAMGVSLNLQKGGNSIIVVEEDWSPSMMDQFYARLHRMGQEKHVHVDTLFADTKINKAVRRIAMAKKNADSKMRDAQQGVE